jgi:hypothetical protein
MYVYHVLVALDWPCVMEGDVYCGVQQQKKEDDFKYDVLGWIVLGVAVIAWMGMAKSSMPPPPPPSSYR